MQRGYMLDEGHHNAKAVASWVEGAPERGWLGLRLKGRMRIPVTAFRCERCGLLESYAMVGP